MFIHEKTKEFCCKNCQFSIYNKYLCGMECGCPGIKQTTDHNDKKNMVVDHLKTEKEIYLYGDSIPDFCPIKTHTIIYKNFGDKNKVIFYDTSNGTIFNITQCKA